MTEEPTRKIGEPGVYRDRIEILYPGEIARITIAQAEGEPPEALYFVEKAPGFRAKWKRTKWRMWGHRRGDPTSLAVRFGESWYEQEEDG